jgi:hypothetical protein
MFFTVVVLVAPLAPVTVTCLVPQPATAMATATINAVISSRLPEMLLLIFMSSSEPAAGPVPEMPMPPVMTEHPAQRQQEQQRQKQHVTTAHREHEEREQ